MKAVWLAVLLLVAVSVRAQTPKPLRVGIAGLTHTHVHWLLGREKRGDVEIVGIAEPNRELAERYVKQHGLSPKLIYPRLDAMVKAAKPEAVTAFNSIYEHLSTVEYCAPRGIHVMVEKPLAVSLDHALRMAELARRHRIHLLTNYETTWYPANHAAYRQLHTIADTTWQPLRPVRKLVFHTGHQGPVEIGCNREFLDWLTDPKYNGGGVLMDFGCYGANLATWLLDGAVPDSVLCLTQHRKPKIYPKVEDEATILLTYPNKAQVIIQASWDWPYARKDMELYGPEQVLMVPDRDHVYLKKEQAGQEALPVPPLAARQDDPFAYLAGVVRGSIQPYPNDLSALENNLVVMRILEAAKSSARTGKVVTISQ